MVTVANFGSKGHKKRALKSICAYNFRKEILTEAFVYLFGAPARLPHSLSSMPTARLAGHTSKMAGIKVIFRGGTQGRIHRKKASKSD